MVGVEDLHRHLLIPGLKDIEGQKGLREKHDLGQGEEGENGW
jgi:hypothetical protein